MINSEDRIEILSNIISISHIDTLYRDQYLRRARSFLEGELSYDLYRSLQKQRTSLVNLPNKIRNAISDGNWSLVSKLSNEHETLKAVIERKGPLYDFGKEVYENTAISIDPFSPGMDTIPGVAKQERSEMHKEAKHHLEDLCRIDHEWQPFYLSRIKTLDNLAGDAGTLAGSIRPTSGQLESEAMAALEGGNFRKLAALSESLSASPVDVAACTETSSRGAASLGDPPDYLFEFSEETIEQARKMGLELQHVKSQHREFEPFIRFAWHPTFTHAQEDHAGVMRVPDLPFPQGTPDALKARIQLFATHPLINSAGIRFLPTMTGEDLLVETYDEPESGRDMPGSGLLEALGLQHRNQLSRKHIEAVLLVRGGQILQDELGLDPFDFRLVCIPPDLHLRLGLERGWGQKKIWTHFDGYLVMMDGTLRPLAGGDIRYGGIYDLLGISRDYDSDHIMLRLAVVQRRRMAIWS